MATATTSTATSAATIGQELVGLCRQGRNGDAIERFYSKDIVSIEPSGTPEMPAQTKGIEAVHTKNRWWSENMEVHSADVRGPYVAGDEFAVCYDYDTTFKPTGQRSAMREMALYSVKDGQIVREEFFYKPSGG